MIKSNIFTKKLICISLILVYIVILTAIPTYADNAKTKLYAVINGKNLDLNTYQQNSDNDYLVPIRPISESLGAIVSWNQETSTLNIKKSSTKITTKLTYSTANDYIQVLKQSNNKSTSVSYDIEMPERPQIVENRLLVPAGVISKCLGAKINLYNQGKQIPINTGNESVSEYEITVTNCEDLYYPLKKALKENVARLKVNIKNSNAKFNYDEFYKVSNQVIEDNPLLLSVKSFVFQDLDSNSDCVSKEIGINYTFPDEMPKMRNELKIKADSIIQSVIKPEMNESQKEKALYDYVIQHAVYDVSNWNNNSIPEADRTAYGILIDGKGVCEGFAAAMKLLLNMVGIECIIVDGTGEGFGVGKGGGHAWNIVKIDGRYYHIDATYDGLAQPDYEKTGYQYFNISDQEISSDHKWDTNEYPVCNTNGRN